MVLATKTTSKPSSQKCTSFTFGYALQSLVCRSAHALSCPALPALPRPHPALRLVPRPALTRLVLCLLAQHLMNAFYDPDTPIESKVFDSKVRVLAKKYLS